MKGMMKPPYHMLGTTTRKRNEIEKLLNQPTYSIEELRVQYTEYLVRLENMIDACGTNDAAQKWMDTHRDDINAFQEKINTILNREHKSRVPKPEFKTEVPVNPLSGAIRKRRVSLPTEPPAKWKHVTPPPLTEFPNPTELGTDWGT